MASIVQAHRGRAVTHARSLMRGLLAWHRERHAEDRVLIDRYFDRTSFERELASLPGPYAPPPPVSLVAKLEQGAAMAIDQARALVPGAPAYVPETYMAVEGFARPIALHRPQAVPAQGGCLLVAYSAGRPAGCVALRELGQGVCELKRMFVPADFRGLGVGRALADRAVAEGRRLGYRQMRLDTSRRQTEAISLYEKTGFKRIAPYYELTEDLKSWLFFFERSL